MRLGRLFAVLALLAPTPAFAGPILATYTFTGQPGTQTSEPVDAQPFGANFSDIVRGSGLIPEDGDHSINSRSWTMGAVIDPTDYYGFTLTPDAGFGVDVDQIAFTERRSGAGVMTFDLRSSLDGYTTALFTFTTPDSTANRRHTVNLGPEFDDLMSAITFRWFGYAAENGSVGTWRLGISASDAGSGLPANVQVSGAIEAVPEPSTLLFVGAGSFAIALLNRRRKA
jgi:hypothetical protein